MLRGDKNKDEMKNKVAGVYWKPVICGFLQLLLNQEQTIHIYHQSQCLSFKAYHTFPYCTPELKSLWADTIWPWLWEGCSHDNPFKSMLSHVLFLPHGGIVIKNTWRGGQPVELCLFPKTSALQSFCPSGGSLLSLGWPTLLQAITKAFPFS